MTDFQATRRFFHLPHGVVYLDGNSLGPLPLPAREAARRVLEDEWGEMVITGWNRAGWIDLPRRVGDKIAPLIGARPGEVVVGDTLSIRLSQALYAALHRSHRKVVLADSGNFPSDLYMAEGLLRAMDRGHELRVVAPEAVEAALDDDVGVLMLTQVDYRTGRVHDMAALSGRAHAVGATTVWDLAHSAGAIPVDLHAAGADFAVGCTYKYLNGGPGAPAFLWAREPDRAATYLNGWLGHAAPFAFEPNYRPAAGVDRFRIGTPAVVQMQVLEAALEVWAGVDMDDLRARSIALSERFIAGIEATCPDLALASPRDPEARGSQVSFRHAEGYAMMQALIAEGVIGDFRAPDMMRFGFAPLYLSEADIDRAVDTLSRIVRDRLWDDPVFATRQAVT